METKKKELHIERQGRITLWSNIHEQIVRAITEEQRGKENSKNGTEN